MSRSSLKIVLGALVVTVSSGITGAAVSQGGGKTVDPSGGAQEPAAAVPAWLKAAAASTVAGFSSADRVDSVEYAPATGAQYYAAVRAYGDGIAAAREHVDEMRDASAADKPQSYVVVYRGEFTFPVPAPMDADGVAQSSMRGEVLVVAFDVETQEAGNISLLGSAEAFDASALPGLAPLDLRH